MPVTSLLLSVTYQSYDMSLVCLSQICYMPVTSLLHVWDISVVWHVSLSHVRHWFMTFVQLPSPYHNCVHDNHVPIMHVILSLSIKNGIISLSFIIEIMFVQMVFMSAFLWHIFCMAFILNLYVVLHMAFMIGFVLDMPFIFMICVLHMSFMFMICVLHISFTCSSCSFQIYVYLSHSMSVICHSTTCIIYYLHMPLITRVYKKGFWSSVNSWDASVGSW